MLGDIRFHFLGRLIRNFVEYFIWKFLFLSIKLSKERLRFVATEIGCTKLELSNLFVHLLEFTIDLPVVGFATVVVRS